MTRAASGRDWPWRALILALFAAPLACQTQSARPDPQCVQLLAVLDRCDPTARGMPASTRRDLAAHCPMLTQCGHTDASTADGCAQFMGCLYDGP